MAGPVPELAASVDAAIESGRFRVALAVVAAARGALSVLAIPLAPFLWRHHFLGVVALRPTKEVLLAAGFKVRVGDLNLVETYAAAVPLAVFGVWIFYWLGRSFSTEIRDGADLPRLVAKVLPAKRIAALQRVLERKGAKVVFFGRLAVFPSSIMAAAAGASGMPPTAFLTADGLGALAAITEVVAAGYVLGEAYERAGTWLTVVGAVVALGLLVALGRWLRAEPVRRRRG